MYNKKDINCNSHNSCYISDKNIIKIDNSNNDLNKSKNKYLGNKKTKENINNSYLMQLYSNNNFDKLELELFPYNIIDHKNLNKLASMIRRNLLNNNERSEYYNKYLNRINYIQESRILPNLKCTLNYQKINISNLDNNKSNINSNKDDYATNNNNIFKNITSKNESKINLDKIELKNKLEKLEHPNIVNTCLIYKMNKEKAIKQLKIDENIKLAEVKESNKNSCFIDDFNENKTNLLEQINSNLKIIHSEELTNYFKYKIDSFKNVHITDNNIKNIILNLE